LVRELAGHGVALAEARGQGCWCVSGRGGAVAAQPWPDVGVAGGDRAGNGQLRGVDRGGGDGPVAGPGDGGG